MDNGYITELANNAFNMDLSDVEIIDDTCVSVNCKNGKRLAGGATIPEKMRALMLIAKNKNADFAVRQQRSFKRLGAMLDMSRGGVMRVEKVKEFITKLAFCGADYVMLYTEDVFELEEYPHFGYVRGRYTDDELIEIDSFAEKLGIEIIPCIQALGHHSKYLSWEESAPIRDTSSVLMVGEEETYKFIRCMIKKMRKVFKSRHIHIGMDETFDLGLGEHLKKYGYCDRAELYFNHLNKVKDICEEHDFSPMIWSDMIFRLNDADYWTTDFVFSEKVKKQIPNVDLVYWEYGSTDEELYDKMIKVHGQLGSKLYFAGGIWTFKGFLPDTFNKSVSAAMPAMRACIKNNVDNVMATIWGDDGCETDYFYALYAFSVYSEFCYNGINTTLAQIQEAAEFVSGYPTELMQACDAFFEDDFEIYGRTLIYGDVFLNICGYDWKNFDRLEIIRKAADSIDQKFEYEKLVMTVALHKAELYAHLQDDYKSGRDLSKYAYKILPQMKKDYEKLFELYSKKWNETNKPFGFENLTARFGGCILRIQCAANTIRSYCEGRINKIEELEYTPLYGEKHGIHYGRIITV